MLKLEQIFAKSRPENLPVPPKSRKFAVPKGKKGQKPANSEKPINTYHYDKKLSQERVQRKPVAESD